jgi:Acyl-CoA dehydrogenases
MDFSLNSEQKMLKDMIYKFTENEIRTQAPIWEANGEYPNEEWMKKYAELGLLGLAWPEKYGGQGLSYLESVLVMEAIARVSPVGAHPIFEANHGPIATVYYYGTEEQREKWIPPVCSGDLIMSVSMTEPEAGSALTDLTTKAVLDGDHYILNGQKRFCTGASHSGAYLVYVRLTEDKGAKGIGAIIVEKDTPGLSFGPLETFMGFRGFPSGDLIFEDCRVPKENLVVPAGGFSKLMTSFNVERLGNTTMSVAVAQGALEESVRYSQERKAFGKPICDFQAIQLQLAEMAMKTEAARLLLYRNAVEASQGTLTVLNSSIGKCFANEMCKEVTDMALNIFGGYGYSVEYPIERMLRDSRGWAIAGGTPQMQRINIAASLIGRRFNHRK